MSNLLAVELEPEVNPKRFKWLGVRDISTKSLYSAVFETCKRGAWRSTGHDIFRAQEQEDAPFGYLF